MASIEFDEPFWENLADSRSVPAAAVAALDELEQRWPGATLPQARPAIAAAVIAALN
jgi:hypothetical protein